MWKDTQHHSPSEKHKSKQQWTITSHQSERLKLTTQETTGVGEDVDKGQPFYPVGRNAKWCSHLGKQYGDSSKS